MSIESVQTYVFSCDDCRVEERVERRSHLSAERPWDPYPDGWTSESRLRSGYKDVPLTGYSAAWAYYNHHRCPKCSTKGPSDE